MATAMFPACGTRSDITSQDNPAANTPVNQATNKCDRLAVNAAFGGPRLCGSRMTGWCEASPYNGLNSCKLFMAQGSADLDLA